MVFGRGGIAKNKSNIKSLKAKCFKNLKNKVGFQNFRKVLIYINFCLKSVKAYYNLNP